jgi:DNA mismatch endonuclease, patch repair protein
VSNGPRPRSDEDKLRLQRQRVGNTRPELELRRHLHALGLRYRVHRRLLTEVRRTHDIVLGPAKTVVEVRGCWWHGCPTHYRPPTNNAAWWARKVKANRKRDADTESRLADLGWHVEVVWEHEDMEQAAIRIAEVVHQRRDHEAIRPPGS